MPSWIGPWEIGIVVVLVLLIFGPRKLPELGSSLGKSIRGFKKGMKDDQDDQDQTSAEAHEATSTDDAPLTKSPTVEPPANSEPVAAAAVNESPKCWGTWEDGNESCLQCAVAAQCAQVGPETPGTE
jgi:sec-independent protein translocase protein TatA